MDESRRKPRVAFFAALPWEYGAFRRSLGPWKGFSTKPFKGFSLSTEDKELLLMETGMGKAMVETALNWAFWAWHPHVLVSFGFAGGLNRSVRVGDIFLCSELSCFDSNVRTMARVRYRMEPHPEILAFCRAHGATAARCITTLHLEPKGFLPAHPDDVPELVDMESHFAAMFAHEHRIPLLCFRAVSDTHNQKLGFDLTEVSDARGHVDPWVVCKTILRNPAVIQAFMASWRRSHRAERNLARLLTAFANLPASRIRAILGPGVSWPEAQLDP